MNPTIGPNKAVAAGVASSITVVILWLVGMSGVTVPAEVAGVLTGIIATLLTYLVPHGGSA